MGRITDSCQCPGFYGISNVYLGLPSVVDRTGVRQCVRLSLTEHEVVALKRSADIIGRHQRGIGLIASAL